MHRFALSPKNRASRGGAPRPIAARTMDWAHGLTRATGGLALGSRRSSDSCVAGAPIAPPDGGHTGPRIGCPCNPDWTTVRQTAAAARIPGGRRQRAENEYCARNSGSSGGHGFHRLGPLSRLRTTCAHCLPASQYRPFGRLVASVPRTSDWPCPPLLRGTSSGSYRESYAPPVGPAERYASSTTIASGHARYISSSHACGRPPAGGGLPRPERSYFPRVARIASIRSMIAFMCRTNARYGSGVARSTPAFFTSS